MKTTEEMISVMQAYVDGKKVEFQPTDSDSWSSCVDPLWDWYGFDYRIAVTKPSINWDHVSPEYKWLAVDKDGGVFLYTKKPLYTEEIWSHGGGMVKAKYFASFTPGDCDWKDSLVERP